MKEAVELMPFFLSILFVFGILIAPFIFMNWLWRKKYKDRRTGRKICGVCGRVADPIVKEEGFLFPRYYCMKHSSLYS